MAPHRIMSGMFFKAGIVLPRHTFLILAICALAGAPAAHAVRTLPVDGRVTSGVGWRLDPFGSGRTVYHHGVDISVPVGTPVHPTQQGYVLFAGPLKNYGYAVAIAHGEGYISLYGHNSEVCVQPGQWVETSTIIARSGNTGRSTGPHVHYEVRRTTGRQKEQQEEFIREMMERISAESAARYGDDEG